METQESWVHPGIPGRFFALLNHEGHEEATKATKRGGMGQHNGKPGAGLSFRLNHG